MSLLIFCLESRTATLRSGVQAMACVVYDDWRYLDAKIRKVESKTKRIYFFLPKRSIFAILMATKVKKSFGLAAFFFRAAAGIPAALADPCTMVEALRFECHGKCLDGRDVSLTQMTA